MEICCKFIHSVKQAPIYRPDVLLNFIYFWTKVSNRDLKTGSVILY